MSGFDPTHAVRFDLPRGSVIAGGDERHVLLSCSALDDLVLVAGTEGAAAIGRTLGTSIGKRIASRLGGTDGVRGATIDAVVGEVAGELAVVGLGAAAIERWGRALVIAIDRPGVSDLPFLAAILEGLLEAATGARLHCAPLGRDGATVARFLIAGEAATSRARTLLGQGLAWGEVLARVQAKGAP